jgi:sulfur carrier protein
MRLVVNGATKEFSDSLTIRQLLESLELTAGPVAVEVNTQVVPRRNHPSHLLKDGDVVEVVHFVGGG